jgi:hypothetical protein
MKRAGFGALPNQTLMNFDAGRNAWKPTKIGMFYDRMLAPVFILI